MCDSIHHFANLSVVCGVSFFCLFLTFSAGSTEQIALPQNLFFIVIRIFTNKYVQFFFYRTKLIGSFGLFSCCAVHQAERLAKIVSELQKKFFYYFKLSNVHTVKKHFRLFGCC